MTNQKDIYYPHTWENRKPTIHEGILFIPPFYFEHKNFEMPEFSDQRFFGNDRPVYVEYCSGNGEWIIEKAKENPEVSWIAVEMKFKRVRKIWSKMRNEKLSNLLIVCGDANTLIHQYLKDCSIDQVFVNFPDPWPKDRHAKNRLIQQPFVLGLKRSLKSDGLCTIVTDHLPYSEQIVSEMNNHFTSIYPMPYFTKKEDSYGSSYFNRLWESKGQEIRLMKFKNAQTL